MWLKHKNTLINLDKVIAVWKLKNSSKKASLWFDYGGDDEQYITFETEEERDMAYSAIIHALGSEVCKIDAE